MTEWVIGQLAARHDRSQFDCGQPLLNDWLRLRAAQFERKRIARTFVATRSDSDEVLGFYSLSAHHVQYQHLTEHLAKGLPRLDVPVILIGRLAVDLRMQRQGLGEALLISAFRRAQTHARSLGIRGIEVDAIDAAAQAFYKRYGFESLTDDRYHLFLALSVVENLKLPPIGE
jgi:GNAT superfamily N-acetyltransferase